MRIQTDLWELSVNSGVSPFDSCFFHHVTRTMSKRADALANRALDKGDENICMADWVARFVGGLEYGGWAASPRLHVCCIFRKS